MLSAEDKLEIRRQIVHILVGVVLLAGLQLEILDDTILLVLALLGSVLSLIVTKRYLPVISEGIRILDRPRDKQRFPGKGAVFFLYGATFAVLFFPMPLALAAIAILTFGDSLSHIVGRFFGSVPLLHQHKMIEGTLVGIVVGATAASYYVPLMHAIVASTVAMLAESIDLQFNRYSVDDNIIIPVVAGFVLSLLAL